MKNILLIVSFTLLFISIGIVWVTANECEASLRQFPDCSSKFVVKSTGVADEPLQFGVHTETNEFGVRTRRVSDNELFELDNGVARHHYSRRQVWNSDETLMVIANKIVDYSTLEIIDKGVGITTELNWSNVEPHTMFGLKRNNGFVNEFVKYDTVSRESSLIKKFDGFTECKMGHGEGNISADDRFVVIVCKNNEQINTLISLDIINKEILGTKTVKDAYDWASFTPSGNYIVVENQYKENSVRELIRYDRTLTDSVQLLGFAEHGDLGIDNHGEDVFVLIDKDYMHSIRVRDGKWLKLNVTGLPSALTKGVVGGVRLGYGHVSCRNIKRPGWCYISSSDEKFVGAVRIAYDAPSESDLVPNSNQAEIRTIGVEQWGYHHTSASTYAAQAKASVSPSGRRVIFTSDLNEQAEINDYVMTFGIN